ncbi:hypothetical protein GPECTOR_8g131 [Gonium pectorale]|uniref:Aldehyde dehydrogenase domain-containing protein n=1 Tax=Gonium pectorale TaxID=33097 RepID=A0A150GS78_GONPE|nr:hypothetical protein GPECTOR_8g131 [Gonium pectorale]|eukprot:KXZ52739.1 hypothetical protein GPECTOR_8g131 [Gonium pectorale]
MTIWTALGGALQPVLGALDRVVPPAPPQPVQLPRRINPQPETPKDRIEEIVERLDSRKAEWSGMPCHARAVLLRRCMTSLMTVGGCVEEELARASTEAKGSYGTGIGEERTALLPVMFGLAEYVSTLKAGGCPPPLALRTRKDGQLVAQVLPAGPVGLLLPSFRGEVWIEPGKPASQGAVYRAKAAGHAGKGAVALVLGAGNQVPVVALDILHKLVAEDEVVVVKTNPVNDYIGPLLRRAFAPLVEAGFLEFVYGGREVGQLLTRHPRIASVHLTGSADTYNDIVWGGAATQRSDSSGGGGGPMPLTATKRVTAELGNVTPYIVVPGGQWCAADVDYHASSIATALAHNAGHNCNGLEVLITDRDWPLRPAFLAAVKEKLSRLPPRQPWYPGARDKYERFRTVYPTAQALGPPGNSPGGPVPWLLAEGLSLEAARGQLQSESWCGVFQEVALPGCGGDPVRFMAAAAHAANTHIAGSLAVGVIAHPSIQEAHPDAWDDFLAGLRYGGIAVNAPLLCLFGQPSLSWGAFPGGTPHDIGSGAGTVHNTFLFDHPQKSVLHGPWRYSPRPFWLVDNSAAGEGWLLPAVLRFVMATADGNLPLALAWVGLAAAAALRG